MNGGDSWLRRAWVWIAGLALVITAMDAMAWWQIFDPGQPATADKPLKFEVLREGAGPVVYNLKGAVSFGFLLDMFF
jgi:hypothetical protein